MLIVLKFGGTSLMDTGRILSAAQKAAALRKQGAQVVVVVSARGHTTDRLLQEAAEIAREAPLREMDVCLAAGEQTSAGLMAMALQTMGVDAVSLTGWQAGILTDGVYSNARILCLQNDRIARELKKGKAVVVAGFQGVDADGNITTLGRGGSDTTAVALAAFLHADLCKIYTDVDGVYDCDPRKYAHAKKYGRISYDEMLRLCHAGAQVLHDRSVEFGKDYGVPIEVLSSFRDLPGTLVTDRIEELSPDLQADIPKNMKNSLDNGIMLC